MKQTIISKFITQNMRLPHRSFFALRNDARVFTDTHGHPTDSNISPLSTPWRGAGGEVKKFLATLFLLITTISISAQITSPNNFLWVKGGGAQGTSPNFNNTEGAEYLACDANKNVYGMSLVNDFMIKIDTFNRNQTYGVDDFVVFSYNCEGKLRWVKHFGGSAYDEPGGLTLDDSGNVYVCGIVGITNIYPGHFGDTTVPAGLFRGQFVMKMDSLGNKIWFRLMPVLQTVPDASRTNGLELDAQGTLHMFTFFSTTNSNWDGFSPTQKSWNVVKLNSSNGMVTGIMKLQMGDKADFFNNYFTMDSLNNYLLVTIPNGGSDTLVINNVNINAEPYATKYVLVKFSNSGNVLWHYISNGPLTGASNYAFFSYKPLIKSNNIYLMGGVHNSGNLFGFNLSNSLATAPGYGPNSSPGIVKVNGANGQGIWANIVNTMQYNIGGQPALLGNGNIALTGTGGQICILNANDTIKPTHGFNVLHPFVTTLDPQTGQFLSGEAIPSDGAGNVVLSAVSDGTPSGLYFGGQFSYKLYNENKADSLVSQGGNADFFVYRYAAPGSCDCPPQAPQASPQMLSLQNKTLTVKANAVTGADSLVWVWGDGSKTKYLSPGTNLMHTYTASGNYTVCLKTYSPCSVEDSCFSVNITTSIATLELEQLSIYPNPVTELLTIDNPYSERAAIVVADIKGAVIFSQALTGHRGTVDMSKLTAGVYTISIQLEDGRRTVRKVVKE